ncbi:uncharacterized protein [Panulirus ornatus]|uniref:uncharacterized protein n=1 Tax=Panulirus ornatus TaxID=150431 RepID=UPI003A85878A
MASRQSTTEKSSNILLLAMAIFGVIFISLALQGLYEYAVIAGVLSALLCLVASCCHQGCKQGQTDLEMARNPRNFGRMETDTQNAPNQPGNVPIAPSFPTTHESSLQELDASRLGPPFSGYSLGEDTAAAQHPPSYFEVHNNNPILSTGEPNPPPYCVIDPMVRETTSSSPSVFQPSADGLPSYEAAMATRTFPS